MITPTHRPERRPRPRYVSRLAIIVAVTLPIAACSSGGHTATDSTGQTGQTDPTSPSTSATSITTDTPTSANTSPLVSDAYDRLNSAIAGLGTEYTFETHTLIDGVEVSVATGRRVGDATEIALTQQGSTILYRTIGSNRWVQLPGGQWNPLPNTNAPGDPLQQISQPKQLVITVGGDSTTTMLATYDAATFSLTNASELTVTLTLTNNTLTAIEYETNQSGRLVHIGSVFQPAVNLEPIAAP